MRKFCSLIICLLSIYTISVAQPYGNEWIDPSLTYYKFKVINKGLHRIPLNSLLQAGIPQDQIVGNRFKLYRDGQEVAIYVTNDGAFGDQDFIEFYGDKNNGKEDKQLYIIPEYHPNDGISLFTDTASYFLTIANSTDGKRMVEVENDLTNPPVKEDYFIYSSRVDVLGTHREGENPNQLLNYVFNSGFDIGEGFSGINIGGPSGVRVTNVLTPFRYLTNNLTARLTGRILFINNSAPHKVRITVDNNDVVTLESNRAGVGVIDQTIPVTSLAITNSFVRLYSLLEGQRDAIFYYQIDYPRLFNFSGNSRFNFRVNKRTDSYVEIANFNAKATTPVVYDLLNNRRYLGRVENNLVKVRFKDSDLPKDSLFISSQAVDDITVVNTITPGFMPDLQEGNFIIITNKKLLSSADGRNYIQEYADYRSSAEGGNHQVAIYYIDELENQFSWGIYHHPLAIRNFVNYAVDNFQIKPENIFIIGKGLSYKVARDVAGVSEISLVQTYGSPASDNLLAARSTISEYPQTGVGRLSARTGEDIKVYLQKIKEYEDNQKTTGASDQTLERKEWMKTVLHLGGGNFVDEQQTFARYLENYRRIIEGQYFGAKVSSVYKNSTDPVQVAQSAYIDSLLYNGTSLITFFGHSSTSTVDFDLEPEGFKNPKGKYPFMFTNGCFVGNIFENYNSYSERFVLTPDRCAIAYLAPMTYAVAYSLNQYANNFYNRLGVVNYADKVGTILKNTATDILGSSLQTDRFLAQQMIYHGDPAIRLNSFEQPDYILTEQNVKFEPNVINASVDSFRILVIGKNIGRAINAEYAVSVERSLPNGEVETYEQRVRAPFYSDTVVFNIPTNNISGLGHNTFRIKVDADDEIEELSELNNEVTISRFFIIDDVIPIYPSEFGIVNYPNPVLSFSTANPLITDKQYILQIDTTEFFNSPLLRTDRSVKKGGVINWQPNIQLIPGKVYYWRGSLDTLYGNPLSWNKSSFLYDPSLSPGWNQSHYFQFIPDVYNSMYLKDDRQFSFINNVRSIKVINGIDAVGYNDRVLFVDNNLIARNSFTKSGFLFYVLDTKTGIPMSTYQVGSTGYGEYGNTIQTLLTDVKIIEFNTANQKDRYSCYYFLKNIVPDQAIVCGYSSANAFLSRWAADDSVVFNGETLFDAFEYIGVTNIRSVQDNEPFVFFTQKGNPLFPTEQIKVSRSEKIDTTFTYVGTWNNGSMLSPLIGPSLGWNTVDFNWKSLDNPVTDEVHFNLYGYASNGVKTRLLEQFSPKVDISFINPEEYPYLQLEMNARDEANSTAPQLDFWRVIYEEIPEGAINPQKHFVKGTDTIPFGATYNCAVAFENITNVNMDSVLVKFSVKDANNQVTTSYKRFAPLPGKQFIVIDFQHVFNQLSNQGLNTITFEANPDNDQKEQLHFNNFAIFTVFLEKDNLNPVMDVTFDGRRIADGEIVSPTPEILIRLKDENRYLALNDTSMFKLFLKSPNSTAFVPLDPRSTEFTFVPADESALDVSNEAKLFFRPSLSEDGTYELRVQGADRSNNDAGKNEYRVQFLVDTRPAISNILNYPNPFSTSTQFIFTVTGTEIPSDLKIQIMTVTGKVVKEITAQELGDIRIGTNITDYKWDGTDMYGDRLANGLYLYRVTARLNGKTMELLEGSADKYFKKGFGKMYIVR